MLDFLHYYTKNKPQYKYTVKLAVNDLGVEDAMLLERYLERYKLIDLKPFTKTPLQSNPLDFPNIRDSEVYITEITSEYPATPFAIQCEIAACLKLAEQCVVVYSENDPRKDYAVEWLERMVNNDEFKENYKPFLGKPMEEEVAPPYGIVGDKDFLKKLNKTEVTAHTNDLIPAQKIEKPEGEKIDYTDDKSDAVLNDRWRNATSYIPKKHVTMMSKPSSEK